MTRKNVTFLTRYMNIEEKCCALWYQTKDTEKNVNITLTTLEGDWG